MPPPAARAIADMMLRALLPSTVGAWVLSVMGTAVWVRGIASRILAAQEAMPRG